MKFHSGTTDFKAPNLSLKQQEALNFINAQKARSSLATREVAKAKFI
ncbi:hypothetical protein VBZ67_05845 [Campylobacter concisus]